MGKQFTMLINADKNKRNRFIRTFKIYAFVERNNKLEKDQVTF
jgi:hypothetical protein